MRMLAVSIPSRTFRRLFGVLACIQLYHPIHFTEKNYAAKFLTCNTKSCVKLKNFTNGTNPPVYVVSVTSTFTLTTVVIVRGLPRITNHVTNIISRADILCNYAMPVIHTYLKKSDLQLLLHAYIVQNLFALLTILCRNKTIIILLNSKNFDDSKILKCS